MLDRLVCPPECPALEQLIDNIGIPLTKIGQPPLTVNNPDFQAGRYFLDGPDVVVLGVDLRPHQNIVMQLVFGCAFRSLDGFESVETVLLIGWGCRGGQETGDRQSQ